MGVGVFVGRGVDEGRRVGVIVGVAVGVHVGGKVAVGCKGSSEATRTEGVDMGGPTAINFGGKGFKKVCGYAQINKYHPPTSMVAEMKRAVI